MKTQPALQSFHRRLRPSKYHNVRVQADGYTFDSKAEGRRYQQLKVLVQQGAIEDLAVHPKYPLVVNGLKVATYIGDFSYRKADSSQVIVEDVKGTILPVYRLKKRLIHAIYGIEIQEVAAR